MAGTQENDASTGEVTTSTGKIIGYTGDTMTYAREVMASPRIKTSWAIDRMSALTGGSGPTENKISPMDKERTMRHLKKEPVIS